jgi:hypothetical protein
VCRESSSVVLVGIVVLGVVVVQWKFELKLLLGMSLVLLGRS